METPIDVSQTQGANMQSNFDEEALIYHTHPTPGKIEVTTTKDVSSEYALSLAYSPGVAVPCRAIEKDPSKAFDYTSKGNLVAVISNGTAVLGLGNIGALAGKPVMEGKGVLFKKFANINVFDIEINEQDPEKFIQIVKSLEPTFGGINLEDISSPACFEIEKRLKEEMNIPVFHDDQHGTAIISAAALLNACELTDRKMQDTKVVVNGAGAAAITCAKLFLKLGIKKENLIMCDSKGVIQTERKDLGSYKEEFAQKTPHRTLADAMKGADVFVGLSVANILSDDMILSMNPNAIIFALANPDPEVNPNHAMTLRSDLIMATGRSDFPNQVNNVLGFPYIFRGALDVRATTINEEMKLAAVYALADLAKETVPDEVSSAYKDKDFHFGKDYIIPKPFDTRVLLKVAPAVAKAAMDTGVAQKPIESFERYVDQLESYLGQKKSFIRPIINRVKAANKSKKTKPRIVLPEGNSRKVLRAIQQVLEEGFATPIIIGNRSSIVKRAAKNELNLIEQAEIISPEEHPRFEEYAEELFKLRCRKGVLQSEIETMLKDPYYFSAMMVRMGDADGVVSGASTSYAKCVKPLLEVIDTAPNKRAAGANIILIDGKMFFFADTTMSMNPSAETLAHIALDVADLAQSYNQTPRVGMLSYTSFSANSENPAKMKKAAELAKAYRPDLVVEGELQADTAINPTILERLYPFSELKGGANILVFPNLDAANISYKIIQQLSHAEVIGPILLGMQKPCNIVQRTGVVADIVNAMALVAHDITQKSAIQHVYAH